MESISGAVQEFFIFDSEIAEATARARMENSLAKKFTVSSVYQRMRSKNFVQPGKRSARGKEKTASREFHSLFLHSGCKLPDGAVSQPPRLGLHPRDEFAGLPVQHFFRGVIGLAEFIRKRFDEVNSLPRKHNRCAFFDTHRDGRGPPGMHAKPNRRLFHMSPRKKTYSGGAPSTISRIISRARDSSSGGA